ncbi:MAG: hypothetical protein WAW17_21625 [Rhodococcus sp. (in: high G+C Gram-positive bacteria)]|uniref:hypothetical protein n=1 Tax=Rhodococcus sp. TaxID=1831 RepID=UPI003BB0CEE6
MSATYALCHRCATAIVNDDYSAFDFDASELADERVRPFLAKAGNIVVNIDETEIDGECDACCQEIDGHGHTAEPQ